MEPTYTVWTPRIAEGAPEVRFNVTPGSVDRWPGGGAEFYRQLLADLEIPAEPVRWSVDPYRTRYHGPAEPTGNPEVDWKRNWRVAVRTEEAPERRVFADAYETEAFDAGPGEPDRHPMLCLVIADFRTAADAEAARAALEKELGGELPGGSGAFESVEVGGADPFWQLQVEAGRFPESFFAGGAPLALRIETRCREMGGWTTFEERVIGLERTGGKA